MNDTTYLSQEKLDKLKQELNFLKNEKRLEIARRIQEAKDLGDLSENAEYAEAKDAYAFNQGRIAELEELINNAVVVDHQYGSKNTITIGSTFKAKTGKETQQFQIVGSQEADPLSGKISNESPLGKAFLGKKAGETAEANVPSGLIKFEILEIL